MSRKKNIKFEIAEQNADASTRRCSHEYFNTTLISRRELIEEKLPGRPRKNQMLWWLLVGGFTPKDIVTLKKISRTQIYRKKSEGF